MPDLVLKVPQELRRGSTRYNEHEAVEEGVNLIRLMCKKFGLEDFGKTSVLDMGCGSKLVQAILDRSLPVGRYVGVDVFPDLIEYLKANVTDPRFSFYVSDTHNEMYNPGGEPLSANTRLPVDEYSFDIVCLFSVFTHLAPHDYVAMLQMLRRYIKPEGRILFSLYVSEATKGGKGWFDALQAAWLGDEKLLEKHKDKFVEATQRGGGAPDFVDYYPDRPLQVAMYSRENALRLVENTGWEVESLNDPETGIQHYMICRPV